MFGTLRSDFRAVFERDPAARNALEVLFCYPGLHAVWCYRFGHLLWRMRLRFLARLLSHVARFLTGIEIHPGARIGPGFFIDHGMGVVIGETTEIGRNVTLYQGVTLGGTSRSREKRHPTIEDDVVVGAGAKVLGPFTVGRGSRVGAGSVVIREVPPGATVVGIPGRVVRAEGAAERGSELEHARLPDPVARALAQLAERIARIESEVGTLQRDAAESSPLEDEP